MAREIDYSRLGKAIQKDRLVLRYAREERRKAVRLFAGNHYSEEGVREKRPINLIAAYCNIISRNLIAKNPRVMLSTFQQAHKRVVSIMESWVNREIERIHFANTMRRVVLDGLFSLGVCKVALASPSDSVLAGWNLPAGSPFVSRVDQDDFAFDTHCRDLLEAGYCAHRYRTPLDVVKDGKYFNKNRNSLEPSDDAFFNQEGDERISVLGRGYYSNQEEYEDFVDLWEVYLPRHRVVLTFADQKGEIISDKPIREQKWIGPECGPYHFLCYGMVPGNPMPKAPVMDLVDLDEFANGVYRKLMRQAERAKQMTFVQGGANEDGNRVLEGNDGEMIRVDNPENIQQVEVGGPMQLLMAIFPDAVNRFSWLAGNLDSMGGLSPQSKTATQDELLAQNASKGVADMQDVTVTHTADVIKAWCWYQHHDPYRTMKVPHSPQHLPEYTMIRQVSAEERSLVPFEELEIKVDPYSMQHSTPQTRLQQMQQTVTTVVLPMMQLLVQQGIAFDVNAYLKKVGQYLDMPDLAEILTIQQPIQPQGGGSGPGMPAETSREYVRKNVSEQTRAGADEQLRNGMMGVPTGGSHKNGQPELNGAMG